MTCIRPDHYPQPDGPGELDPHLHAAGRVVYEDGHVQVVVRTPCVADDAPVAANPVRAARRQALMDVGCLYALSTQWPCREKKGLKPTYWCRVCRMLDEMERP